MNERSDMKNWWINNVRYNVLSLTDFRPVCDCLGTPLPKSNNPNQVHSAKNTGSVSFWSYLRSMFARCDNPQSAASCMQMWYCYGNLGQQYQQPSFVFQFKVHPFRTNILQIYRIWWLHHRAYTHQINASTRPPISRYRSVTKWSLKFKIKVNQKVYKLKVKKQISVNNETEKNNPIDLNTYTHKNIVVK